MAWKIFRWRGTRRGNNAALTPNNNGHGRNVYTMQISLQVIVGEYKDALEALNRACRLCQAVSFDIKDMPMKESDRVMATMRPKTARKWLVVALYRELLEANSKRPQGDSLIVTGFEADDPEQLAERVNDKIRGREVADIQLLFDKQVGNWKAAVSFPYSLARECVV